MFQDWKNYSIGIIALLAMLGLFTLRGKFLGTSDTPSINVPSMSPKPEKVTEKIRLLIRSEEDNEPIEGVSVEFAVSNGSSSIKKTGRDGYVDIEIPQGIDVAIYLKHKDYFPSKYTLNSNVESNKTKDYFLQRKSKPNLSSSIPQAPGSTITGDWEGKYTCSQGITGVTVAITQTGDKVIADFSLYAVPENPNVPPGLSRYKGDFNSTSRRMSFPEGTWINKPAPFWTAFGFHGEFDENLETFSGKLDDYSCTTINLRRKHRSQIRYIYWA